MSIQKFNDFSNLSRLQCPDIERMFLDIFDIVDDFNEDYEFKLNVNLYITDPVSSFIYLGYTHDVSGNNFVYLNDRSINKAVVLIWNDLRKMGITLGHKSTSNPKLSDCINIVLDHYEGEPPSILLEITNPQNLRHLLDSSVLPKLISLKERIWSTFLISTTRRKFDPGLKEKGMIDKYGSKSPFLVPEIKEKIQSTNLDKFGHISPLGNKEIQQKCIENVIKIYGVDNVWKNKDMIKYFIERKRELGIYYKDDEIKNKYLQFRKKVVYLYKNKSKLLEIWDGKDFYTGEYIKDNFNLNFNDNKYPTIDHKISIFFGYVNKMDINDIISLDNLCWTTRINNLRKNKREISIFQNELNNYLNIN